VPTTWSETENIAWKVAIPGSGWSSPVVADGQIWLTTATDDGRSLRAVCIDRESGQIQHNVEAFTRPNAEHVHSQNSHATPTPIIDGDRVFAHFGRNGTACLSRDGGIVWRNTELVYSTPHGSANSPVLHGNMLIVCCDGTDKQFVVALDKQSGRVIWKRDRTHLEDANRKSSEEKNESRKGLPFIAFSTPLVIDVEGTPLLISTPADHVVANRVDTGEEVWWLPYNCFSLVARPVFGNGMVYAIGGLKDGHYALYAIRADARGKISEENLAWKRTKSIPQCPSPVLIGNELFLIKDSGIATCLNATTGEELWQKRIGGTYRASPVAVGDHVYFCSQKGKTTVLKLGTKYSPVATNQLDGIFLASPAIAGQSLFLRSDTHLYRIESP
jgi:outer membrane protein assembly factor BamB